MTLQNAKELVKNGERQQALASFSQLLQTQPKEADFYTSFASLLFDMGEIVAAEKMASTATTQQNITADTWLMCAKIYTKAGYTDPAITSFTEALKLDEKHQETCFEYGLFLKDKHDYVQAVKYFSEVNTPTAKLYLGLCYKYLGEDEKTQNTFLEIIKTDPLYAPVYSQYLNILVDAERFDDFMDLYDNTYIKKHEKTQAMAILNIGKALILYLQNKMENINELLEISHFDIPKLNIISERRYLLHMLIFRQCLRDLMKYKAKNPELYNGEVKERIHVIGDSHTLFSAWLKVNGKEIAPRLVMGCKIWHLADKNDNAFRKSFEKIMSGLAKNTKVILSVGEIDCRDDEGFLPFFLKTPDIKTDEFVKKTVKNYITWAKNIADKQPLNITICGVPAPNGSTYAPNTPEGDLKLSIVKTINESLELFSKENNLGFITPYNDENGWGKKEDFIDRFHLKPQVYVGLLEEV
jgi:Tfp pilus assembly protein PilF